MKPSPAEPKQAVARILGPSGQPLGAGCLTQNALVVTCAHVVRDALGLKKMTGARPQGRLKLDFPFLPENRGRTQFPLFEAEVAPNGWGWIEEEAPGSDIAILRLISEPPFACGWLFALSDQMDKKLEVFLQGFPVDAALGAGPVFAVLADHGRTAAGTRILDSSESAYLIRPGFSGAPVFPRTGGQAAGMLIANPVFYKGGGLREADRIAYVIPSGRIYEQIASVLEQKQEPLVHPVEFALNGKNEDTLLAAKPIADIQTGLYAANPSEEMAQDDSGEAPLLRGPLPAYDENSYFVPPELKQTGANKTLPVDIGTIERRLWIHIKRWTPILGTAVVLAAIVPWLPLPCFNGTLVSLASGNSRCIQAGSGEVFQDCPDCPNMVVVPNGHFVMGSSDAEIDTLSKIYEEHKDVLQYETPQHKVKIPTSFAVSQSEVTFLDWELCIKGGGCTSSPKSEGGSGADPLVNVSWREIHEQYLPWLRNKTGKKYRLLSESEWEYVARAGTTGNFSFNGLISAAKANYRSDFSFDNSPTTQNPLNAAMPALSLSPNAWGLYHVHGNAQELVSDDWHEKYEHQAKNSFDNESSSEAKKDGYAVIRGGSWYNKPIDVRSASRFKHHRTDKSPTVGFRLARGI